MRALHTRQFPTVFNDIFLVAHTGVTLVTDSIQSRLSSLVWWALFQSHLHLFLLTPWHKVRTNWACSAFLDHRVWLDFNCLIALCSGTCVEASALIMFLHLLENEGFSGFSYNLSPVGFYHCQIVEKYWQRCLIPTHPHTETTDWSIVPKHGCRSLTAAQISGLHRMVRLRFV